MPIYGAIDSIISPRIFRSEGNMPGKGGVVSRQYSYFRE
jgi:hypothetical protein